MNIEKATELALSYQDAEESPHFEKTSFRVRKKIFATLDLNQKNLVVKLSELDQSIYAQITDQTIEPISGAWGKQGWTRVELLNMDEHLLREILTKSYCLVAPKKLGDIYKEESN